MYRLHCRTRIAFLDCFKTREIRVSDRATCSSLAALRRTLATPLRKNVAMTANGSARARVVPSPASPEEAAAIVAAIERFTRATAPPTAANPPAGLDGWHAAALVEGVSRDPWATSIGDEWLNTPPG